MEITKRNLYRISKYLVLALVPGDLQAPISSGVVFGMLMVSLRLASRMLFRGCLSHHVITTIFDSKDLNFRDKQTQS